MTRQPENRYRKIGTSTLRQSQCTEQLEPAARQPVGDRIQALVFSPDGTRLASGSADGTVHLCNITGTAPPTVLDGHQGGVWSVTFSRDGRTLILIVLLSKQRQRHREIDHHMRRKLAIRPLRLPTRHHDGLWQPTPPQWIL
jgi:WD40 repeat protein